MELVKMLLGVFLMINIFQFAYVHGQSPAEQCKSGKFDVSSAELEGCSETICNLQRGKTYEVKFSAEVEEEEVNEVSLLRKFYWTKNGNAPQVTTDDDVLSSIKLGNDSGSPGTFLTINSQLYPSANIFLEVLLNSETEGEQKIVKVGPLIGPLTKAILNGPIDIPFLGNEENRGNGSPLPINSGIEIFDTLKIKSPLAGTTEREATLPLKNGQEFDFIYKFTVPDDAWTESNWLEFQLKGDGGVELYCFQVPVTVSENN